MTGVHEQPQAFSIFGGWGAGDLIDGVLAPDAVALVGRGRARAPPRPGCSTADGETWSRIDSTGTLASTRQSLGFMTDATNLGSGIVVAGWQVARAAPVVWQSAALTSG